MNPPFTSARAVATIFPSGDRASADQIVSPPLQLDKRAFMPRSTSRIVLGLPNEPPRPNLLVTRMLSPSPDMKGKIGSQIPVPLSRQTSIACGGLGSFVF
jgi:hypothetical protein